MTKILFSQLDGSLQISRCTIPQHVSVTKNPDEETYDQIVERQSRFLQLPIPLKDKLSSLETGDKIQKIGEKYNLQLLQLADIARAIRSYYFKEIKLEDFPQILSREIGLDLNTAGEISQIVIREIIKDRSQEKEYQTSHESIGISETLQKYPEVGEQIITSQHIRLKIFPEPVRSSIKNWLSDYTFGLGYESHDSMTRGNYLFKSENGKGLSQEDREKLSLILKSYDENVPLTIDTAIKQVLFPETQIKKENKPEIVTPTEPSNPEPIAISKPDTQEPNVITGSEEEKEPTLEANNIQFSSPQVFANEKKVEKPRISQPIRISPSSRESFDRYSQKERENLGNIVDLKGRV